MVNVDDNVIKGDRIGIMESEPSGGYALHFEVWMEGKAVDPLSLLKPANKGCGIHYEIGSLDVDVNISITLVVLIVIAIFLGNGTEIATIFSSLWLTKQAMF